MHESHPVAFVSKSLGPKLRGLSTYEKKYVVILLVVEQWRYYLQLGEFVISTDQKSLSHLNEQMLHTSCQQKVFTNLLDLNYRIVYKKGSDNRVVDALSRGPDHYSSSVVCNAISSPQPKWVDEVAGSYSGDPVVQQMIAKLVIDKDVVPHFSWSQGLLRYKNRIWVGKDVDLQLILVAAFHSSVTGGQSRILVTHNRLKQVLAWTGMKATIHEFVKSCIVCQHAKSDRDKSPGLLEPLSVPDGAWIVIMMDFVGFAPI
jgi:hypothetical protein